MTDLREKFEDIVTDAVIGEICPEGAADAIIAILRDSVKPLEWKYDAGLYGASCILGCFEIQAETGEEDVMFSLNGSYCRTVYETVADAKEAVERYRTHRILSHMGLDT